MTAKAVIQTGGKQYLVATGAKVRIEQLRGKTLDEVVTFDDVRLLIEDGKVTVGEPNIAGAKVQGTILEISKDKKVTGVKFMRRRRYLKRLGHRQTKAIVEITAVRGEATP